MYSHANTGLISSGILNLLPSSSPVQVAPQEKRENRLQSAQSAKRRKPNQTIPVTSLQPVTYTPPIIIAGREEIPDEVRQLREDKANLEASMASALYQLNAYYTTQVKLEETREALSQSITQVSDFNSLVNVCQRRNVELTASLNQLSAQTDRNEQKINQLQSVVKDLQTTNRDLRQKNEKLVRQESNWQRQIGEFKGLISAHQSKEAVYASKIAKLEAAERSNKEELEKQLKRSQEAEDSIKVLIDSQKIMSSSNQVLQQSVNYLNSTVSAQQYMLNNQRQIGASGFLPYPTPLTPLQANTIFSTPAALPIQPPLTQGLTSTPATLPAPSSAFIKPIARRAGPE